MPRLRARRWRGAASSGALTAVDAAPSDAGRQSAVQEQDEFATKLMTTVIEPLQQRIKEHEVQRKAVRLPDGMLLALMRSVLC